MVAQAEGGVAVNNWNTHSTTVSLGIPRGSSVNPFRVQLTNRGRLLVQLQTSQACLLACATTPHTRHKITRKNATFKLISRLSMDGVSYCHELGKVVSQVSRYSRILQLSG